MKKNSEPVLITTAADCDHNNNSTASLSPPPPPHHHHTPPPPPPPQQHHHLASISESLQHPSSLSTDADLTKRKSPSIFSSVEELARGSKATRPTTTLIISSPGLISDHVTSPGLISNHVTSPGLIHDHVTSPGLVSDHVTSPGLISNHVTSTPLTQRSPLMFDMSTDSGYGDSALRDVTHGLDRIPEVVSKTADDVIATPLKMAADCRPIAIKPVATVASVLRHQIISISAIDPVAADASKTALHEKLQLGSDRSVLISAAMETASSPQLQQQSQENLEQTHVGYDARNTQLILRESPQLTDGRIYLENKDKLEVIHGGFGVKNPLLTRVTDPSIGTTTNSQLSSKNVGKSYYYSFTVGVQV